MSDREQLQFHLSAPSSTILGMCLRLIKKDGCLPSGRELVEELILARVAPLAAQRYEYGTPAEQWQILARCLAKLQSYQLEHLLAFRVPNSAIANLLPHPSGLILPGQPDRPSAPDNSSTATNSERADDSRNNGNNPGNGRNKRSSA